MFEKEEVDRMKHKIRGFASFICVIINVVGCVINYKDGDYGFAIVNVCLAGVCFILMLWNIKESE